MEVCNNTWLFDKEGDAMRCIQLLFQFVQAVVHRLCFATPRLTQQEQGFAFLDTEYKFRRLIFLYYP